MPSPSIWIHPHHIHFHCIPRFPYRSSPTQISTRKSPPHTTTFLQRVKQKNKTHSQRIESKSFVLFHGISNEVNSNSGQGPYGSRLRLRLSMNNYRHPRIMKARILPIRWWLLEWSKNQERSIIGSLVNATRMQRRQSNSSTTVDDQVRHRRTRHTLIESQKGEA